MVVGFITAVTWIVGIVGIYFLGKGSGATDFGDEVLNNSTIENEVKKSISSTFFLLQKWRPCINHYCNIWNIAIPSITCMLSVFFVVVVVVVVEDATEEQKVTIEKSFMQWKIEIIQHKS